MDNFSTRLLSVSDLHELDKKNKIKYNKNRHHKWGKSQRKSFIKNLKKGYPVRPILCSTVIEKKSVTYFIYDGYNRIRAIMKYLKKEEDQELMNKLLVLSVIPSNISESDLDKIYTILGC